MATSTTFQGKPKPMGRPGMYFEPQRHALQARGIRTGNLSGSQVYKEYGITNLEKPRIPLDTTPKTEEGLEDLQAEAIEEKESQPRKVTFTERLQKMESSLQASIKRNKALKARQRQEHLYEEVGRKAPEQEEEETDEDEEVDSESIPAKLGEILANLDDDYDSEDLVGLNNKELELLAVRFRSQNKDGLFGEPENPFLAELKNRIEAQKEIDRNKAQIRAELKKKPEKEETLFGELFG